MDTKPTSPAIGGLIEGTLRRYHIESVVSETSSGTVYRAFARSGSGKGFIRRYYAIVSMPEDASVVDFDQTLQYSLLAAPMPLHVEEELPDGERKMVVVAKGAERRRLGKLLRPLHNHGYLMLLLTALILILLIVRYFST